MPAQRSGWVRRALRDGRASVVRRAPFTIQLNYEATEQVQPITLGIDTGYATVGASAVCAHGELFSAELTLLPGISERLTKRSQYRRTRRGNLRHRKPGYHKDTKPPGWLAPSLQHKLDTHLRLIDRVKSILPVTQTILEVAAFDTHKLKNPDVEGVGYQQGEQYGFENLREYVLHRDGHKCQNPKCKNKARSPILQVHHIGYWKQDRSDRPANLITLCNPCHTPANHQPGGSLHGWQPKIPSLKAATFMSVLRWNLLKQSGAVATYGYLTKGRRKALGLEKTHANDAFVIACGTTQTRAKTLNPVQNRRNNRSLSRFYDARYIDLRDGEIRSGKELSSPRTRRTRVNLPPSLRVHRARKVKQGRVSLRTERHPFQPGDLVRVGNVIHWVKGAHCNGDRILMHSGQSIAVKKVRLIRYGKGISFNMLPRRRDSSPSSAKAVGGGILAKD